MLQQFQNEESTNFLDTAETPAHVFAFKAFKTALFGTSDPAAPCASNSSKIEHDTKIHDNRNAKSDVPQKAKDTKDTEESKRIDGIPETTPQKHIKAADLLTSPSKGILLTPGMGASRRKNVSFKQCLRQDTHDRPESKADRKPTSHPGWDPFAIGKFGCQSIASTQPDALSQQKLPEPPMNSVARSSDVVDAAPADSETTADLSHPRSRSGHYWKAEFERYHARSEREMRMIIKAGQVAKSYAAKKDQECLVLSQKLQKERHRVVALEKQFEHLRQSTLERKDPDRTSPTRLTARTDTASQAELEALRNLAASTEKCNMRLQMENAKLADELQILRREVQSTRGFSRPNRADHTASEPFRIPSTPPIARSSPKSVRSFAQDFNTSAVDVWIPPVPTSYSPESPKHTDRRAADSVISPSTARAARVSKSFEALRETSGNNGDHGNSMRQLVRDVENLQCNLPNFPVAKVCHTSLGKKQGTQPLRFSSPAKYGQDQMSYEDLPAYSDAFQRERGVTTQSRPRKLALSPTRAAAAKARLLQRSVNKRQGVKSEAF